MNHRKFLYCIFLFTILLICSCSGPIPTPQKDAVKLVSLIGQIDVLQSTADSWSTDAYLVSADLPIQIGQTVPWLIGAEFQSPTHEKETLDVKMLLDRTLTSQRFQSEEPVYQQAPITRENIQVDSQQALDSLLDDAGKNFLKSHPLHCSNLSLQRDLARSDEPVIWILTLSSCGTTSAEYTFLNPATGEIGKYSK